MWRISRAFLTSYVWLCVLSILCIGHPLVQRLLLLIWIIRVASLMEAERQSGRPLEALLGMLTISQAPGILLVFVSSWYAATGGASEWPSGLMEIWYHPFIYLVELLPSRRFGEWSDMYLATSFVPLLIVLSSFVCSVVLGRLKIRWVRRFR